MFSHWIPQRVCFKLITATLQMDHSKFIQEALAFLNLNFVPKQFQTDVIESYMQDKDTFCIAATGQGKSLTYILAPIVKDLTKGITL